MSIADIQKKVKAQEMQNIPGAYDNTPKQTMLNAKDVQEANPDKRVRWLNLRNPDKMSSRLAEGYTRMPKEEGGRSLGDEMALFAIPRSAYDRRVAYQNAENDRRTTAHNKEWERIADGVAKELRDKHGISVDPERLRKE
ncbi:hypothetical protein UFOVP1537_3 [uncultured Caudovirales phage]|uniref:Uncharacterized protein n=2 Tax=root TaxID=1 RepID=A0A6J5SSK5_9CAUD|nr:hypothetical protein UFOVP825_21 [uncultured Caudovirales phage]CAB4171168.1 hypothetical protein UFOVP915_3 [uncultured Caudovirales phage]CAB4177203.1 hypothetical protein UFOVP1000_20 [uncultured Caudovirales phage]CAB4183296.1 hypothetical protein UFOVP1092_48 [uncultured Caudovirales phage]CAB4187723.1 hypothetical protein UFOVP1152_52 [uncultured Caudovirales phage]